MKKIILITLLMLFGCLNKGEELKDNSNDFVSMRMNMVKYQIENRGVRSSVVLEAMKKVERHLFVPKDIEHIAYQDSPLPIGRGQTISQPYIVAFMTEMLDCQKDDVVLEIGTGSGYQAAVLCEITSFVYTIEIEEYLCESSRKKLKDLGYENVEVICGDGYKGYPEKAPFDKIIVTAAPGHIPQPLVDQLKVGGKMIIPVGDFFQELILIEKTEKDVVKRSVLPVRFVPLVDEEGKKY